MPTRSIATAVLTCMPGGMLSFGDGHAVQGDGEVSLTALETSLSGTVQIILHKGMGRIVGEGRGVLRLESIKRIVAKGE